LSNAKKEKDEKKKVFKENGKRGKKNCIDIKSCERQIF